MLNVRKASVDWAMTGVATPSMSAASAVEVNLWPMISPSFLPAALRGGEETLGRGASPKSGRRLFSSRLGEDHVTVGGGYRLKVIEITQGGDEAIDVASVEHAADADRRDAFIAELDRL